MGLKFRDMLTLLIVVSLQYYSSFAWASPALSSSGVDDVDPDEITKEEYSDFLQDTYDHELDDALNSDLIPVPETVYDTHPLPVKHHSKKPKYGVVQEQQPGADDSWSNIKGQFKQQDGGTDPNDCWLKLNAAKFFEIMDNLDKQFAQVRQDYHFNVAESMDRQMLDELLSSRGAAHRAVHKAGGDSNLIPAGLNLGGYCMMRQEDSILFFHRMKLRNSTNFQVKYLHNDLENMVLIAHLGLNDLHLLGSYERAASTRQDPSVLYYKPSYGSIELLLKNVDYKMEARLRMMSDRITIEVINSELVINDGILMTYSNIHLKNVPDDFVNVEARNLEDFLQRLKTDLDLWLKDYFNDYLMYFQLPDYDNTQFQEYEKKKTILLNEYLDYAVNAIRQKIMKLGGHALKLPTFTIYSVPNMILKIKDGVLRGMDTMHQRSVGTGMKNQTVRRVDAIVGFSKLKVEYKLEVTLPNGTPPHTGFLILTVDEMTVHMGISLMKEPEFVDLHFDFIQQMKPESLAMEGPTNRLIANYKHHLEHTIIAMMSNGLIHNIKMLNTITRCVPSFYGHSGEGLSNDLPIEEEDTQGKYNLRNAKKSKAGRRHSERNQTS